MLRRACLLAGPDCDNAARLAVPGSSRCAAHQLGSGWGKRPPANAYAYSGDWSERRRRVLERDAFRCRLGFAGCLVRASEVDHVVQPEAGGDNSLSNLRAVCRRCHATRTGRQGALATQRRRSVTSGREEP
jgi:5-methylcytosine-specific restriction protein A